MRGKRVGEAPVDRCQHRCHPLTHTHSLCLSHTLSLSHTHTLALSLSHTHSLSLSHTHTSGAAAERVHATPSRLRVAPL